MEDSSDAKVQPVPYHRLIAHLQTVIQACSGGCHIVEHAIERLPGHFG